MCCFLDVLPVPLQAELEAPFHLLVGLAQHVVAWEPRKTLNIFFEELLEFQCCISFILTTAVSAVSPPFVFAALEQ